MLDKTERQRIVLNLISRESIQSQEELQAKVAELGVMATQATLSRDLRELGVVKKHVPGKGYAYVAVSDGSDSPGEPSVAKGVTSIEFSASFCVIKTRPGYASFVAALIDAGNLREIAGTLAGDDTIMMVVRQGFQNYRVLESLGSVIPGIEEKLLA